MNHEVMNVMCCALRGEQCGAVCGECHQLSSLAVQGIPTIDATPAH